MFVKAQDCTALFETIQHVVKGKTLALGADTVHKKRLLMSNISESDNKHMRQLIGNAILDKLEPEALSVATGSIPDTLLASIAISMKRIVKLLEEIEPKP